MRGENGFAFRGDGSADWSPWGKASAFGSVSWPGKAAAGRETNLALICKIPCSDGEREGPLRTERQKANCKRQKAKIKEGGIV